MTDPTQLAVPAGTHQSFSIELECLIAYIPMEGKDPDEFTIEGLPPLLRVNFDGDEVTEILSHILDTLDSYSVPAVSQSSDPIQSSKTTDLPSPSQDIDPSVWAISATSSANEYFLAGYFWQTLRIRSPVMWSQEESFTQIQFIVNLLTSNYRLRVNPTCNFSVRVGNGTSLFTEATIKRIGAFLWAADPMFSRLHAPWRRVNDKSQSIRLESNLARDTTAEQVSGKWEGGWLREYDPITLTEISNKVPREERERGSKEKGAEFAKWRNEVGPFMALGKDIDDINRNGNDGSNKNDKSNKDNNSSSSDESSSDDDEWWDKSLARSEESEIRLPLLDDVLAEGHRALKEDRQIHAPPDLNTLYRNVGWAFWDKSQDPRMVNWLYEYCQENYGHTKLYKLPAQEQITLVLRTQCAVLYNHTDLRELNGDQEYDVLVAASQYISASRSSWEWDVDTEEWELAWRRVGNIIQHPAAHREIKIDAPQVIEKFENLVKLTDLHSEDNELGIQYLNPQDHIEAISTNKGIEELLDDLKDYADPIDPNFMDYLADPRGIEWFDGLRVNSSSSVYSTNTPSNNPNDQFPPEGFYGEGWKALMKDIRKFGRIAGTRSAHDSDSTFSFPSSSSVYSVRVPSNPPSDPPVEDLEASYDQKMEDVWDYIQNLETPDSQLEDMFQSRIADNNSDLDSGPTVTAEQGVTKITACDTATTAAEPLCRESLQLNYDFTPCSVSSLKTPPDPIQRMIDFREVGGSLDAGWITTWARICTGIVRWASCVSADEYMGVLDEVLAQDRRELKTVAVEKEMGGGPDGKGAGEEEGYDVCCLLEDLGLFPEAAWVWRRQLGAGSSR
ncbi:uncharacterized protein GGS22DRAFT_194163 [Annulohypoxylon maeteangense]|uniref:uncharacterized protein n=1 Tax=Annulohypoxylon maeteangense TaxID=1927788 RepID=UPI0020078870|nr:uncharacterized protein GGS22DRAFT_194163 [Annulohypoxylon maeteangense]KAI0889813.1 hypothetical protein GGS22DRAFT_194163 [Annulohypoxylon maeteangense]